MNPKIALALALVLLSSGCGPSAPPSPTATASPSSPHPEPSRTRLSPRLPQATKTMEMKFPGGNAQYFTFSPDGQMLATWAEDHIQLWDAATGQALGDLKGLRGMLGFSRSGQQLLTVAAGKLETWQAPGLKPEGSPKPLTAGARSADGSWSVRGQSGKLMICQLPTGYALPLDHPERANESAYHLVGNQARNLVAAAVGESAVLSSWKEGKRLWTSPPLGRDVTSVAFSGDGKWLAYGTMGGSFFVADTESKQVVGHGNTDGEIRCLAAARDGRRFAVGCADRSSKIFLYDSSGETLTVIAPGPGRDTWALAFSPDGKVLASGHETGQIYLWKLP